MIKSLSLRIIQAKTGCGVGVLIARRRVTDVSPKCVRHAFPLELRPESPRWPLPHDTLFVAVALGATQTANNTSATALMLMNHTISTDASC